MVKLDNASREELLRVIAEQQQVLMRQQEVIARLQARINDLERRLGSGGPRGMPGVKPTEPPPARSKPARKRRPHGFARVRSTPTAVVEHGTDACPDCGIRLLGGSVKRRREVLEIVVTPAQATEHRYLERRCPGCGRRWVPKVALEGVVLGRQRLGVGLVSLIATLRGDGRLPLRTIQRYLATVHQVHLSLGGISASLRQVADHGQPAVRQIRTEMRASPAVHADETGWRENGRNRYVWTFSTPRERYFVCGRRDKGVVDEVLGDDFSGILASDFYAAYNHYSGAHQRCWAHLLREIHELTVLYPDDRGLRRWATRVHQCYANSVAFRGASERERLRAKLHFEQRLLANCRPFLTDEAAVQGRLCRRIERFLSELFVFVSHPEVPPDNNAAERSLRDLVTARKISGGTRSPAGTTTRMTLATLFGTWRARNLDPLRACRQLLAYPQI